MANKNDPVIIKEYDPSWPIEFEKLSKVIKDKIGKFILSIKHVGSTSVPGLMAKPIIDMDIIIDSDEKLSKVIEGLRELGYEHQGNMGIEGREAFKRESDRVPYNSDENQWLDHHLYVCKEDSEALYNHLTFRNHLRKNPDSVKEYGNLKKDLSKKFRHDRISYTESKTDFINGILNKYK